MWDDLRDPLALEEDPVFLSESSIFTFDAMISTLVELCDLLPQLMIRHAPRVTLPHLKSSYDTPPRSSAEILRLVMEATLGNVTTGGVKWNAKEYRFIWNANGGRAVGLEAVTTSS
jgi:hypothetical protein